MYQERIAMQIDMLDRLQKPATVEDLINEASKIKSAVTEAVDDGVKSALRAIKQGRDVAEDAIDDAKRAVKRNPLQAVGIFFAAGVVAGCVVTRLGFRRR
jgi:ElaB/YqjD/DUF883 family membrane-anchored ribosome-binding protein